MDASSDPVDNFKRPSLPPTISSNEFKKPTIPTPNLDAQLEKDKVTNTDITSENKEPKNKKEKRLVNVPIPYNEPEWKGHPPGSYSLEIIKNGTFVSYLPIKASLVVFGRLDVCDIVFEHPSVSRYHAVIQYCKGDDAHPRGFYLYDLGSTHGTFLNKDKIKPKIYYKLKVGYILKFGGSSRLHIFQGPEEEEEELKEEPTVPKEVENEGCNWGMGEEATEEEDLSINPFALTGNNEDLYIDDPKKTLRGWFEREGYELEYKVEEKGFRTFCCTIQLPVDTSAGEYLPVEASVNGKKKEAIVACALEACRTLDKLGLLRQSQQESRQLKRKKWEENDYYDSDEDTFYDRTGEIEKRREMRKRLTKKVEVDNYESLAVKLEKLNAEVKEIQSKIMSKTNNTRSAASAESDPLDMYMSDLSQVDSSISDKFERRKLKLRLIELEKEKIRLEKLSNIAKPSVSLKSNHPGIIGKRPKSKLKISAAIPEKVPKSAAGEEQIEENDSDEEKEPTELKKEEKEASEIKEEEKAHNVENNEQTAKYGLILNPSLKVEQSEPLSSNTKDDEVEAMDYIDAKPVEAKNIKPSDEQHDSNKTLQSTKLESSPSDKLKKSVKDMKSKENLKKGDSVDVYKTSTNEYCTWMPPSGQSGDGMTYLNEKYGY